MKKKIVILCACAVIAIGTLGVFASGVFNNQGVNQQSDISATTNSDKDSDQPISNTQTSKISNGETINGTNVRANVEQTEAMYPSNFYAMVQVLNENISDTSGIASILSSYLYLKDVHSLNNEQLEYIAELIIGGADPNDIIDIAYFWVDTCEDITIIGQIYDKKSDYEGGRFWIENAYNNVTNYVHGVLVSEDINNYLLSGLTVTDIQNANVLSRKGVYTIKQILDKLVGGDLIINIMNEIYGTSINQPISLFGLNENENSDQNILNSKELSKLENKQIEESASEILSDEDTSERLVDKRNQKSAELIKQLINDGVIRGSIDEDLGVVFDD